MRDDIQDKFIEELIERVEKLEKSNLPYDAKKHKDWQNRVNEKIEKLEKDLKGMNLNQNLTLRMIKKLESKTEKDGTTVLMHMKIIADMQKRVDKLERLSGASECEQYYECGKCGHVEFKEASGKSDEAIRKENTKLFKTLLGDNYDEWAEKYKDSVLITDPKEAPKEIICKDCLWQYQCGNVDNYKGYCTNYKPIPQGFQRIEDTIAQLKTTINYIKQGWNIDAIFDEIDNYVKELEAEERDD